MPLFTQYQELFESNPRMRDVLVVNFQDILEFHSEALKFFRGKSKYHYPTELQDFVANTNGTNAA